MSLYQYVIALCQQTNWHGIANKQQKQLWFTRTLHIHYITTQSWTVTVPHWCIIHYAAWLYSQSRNKKKKQFGIRYLTFQLKNVLMCTTSYRLTLCKVSEPEQLACAHSMVGRHLLLQPVASVWSWCMLQALEFNIIAFSHSSVRLLARLSSEMKLTKVYALLQDAVAEGQEIERIRTRWC